MTCPTKEHATPDECMHAEHVADAHTCRELMQRENKNGKISPEAGCDNKEFLVMRGHHYVDVVCIKCHSTLRYMLGVK